MSSQSYDYLNNIDFIKLYSREIETENQLITIFNDLQNCLLSDFDKILFEKKKISRIKIEYDNPEYRQSATGIIYILNFTDDENFKIHIEVLIDFQRILICTKGIPERETLKELNKKIVVKYNHEAKTELKELLQSL